jgi:hypothetical protein
MKHLTTTQDALTDTVPWYPITPDPAPPVTQQIDIEFGQNETGNWVVSIPLPSNHLISHYPVDHEWRVFPSKLQPTHPTPLKDRQ